MMYRIFILCKMLLCLLLTGCEDLFYVRPQKYNRAHKTYTIKNSFGTFKVTPSKHIQLSEKGIASYYGKECHGKLTACGMKFNMFAYTAAHKTAHLPCVALISYKNQTRVVLINDRGPFAKNRILDSSRKLAKDLGYEGFGFAPVHVKVLKNETLALRQNGGHIDWDGTTPFPLTTKHTRHCAHFYPIVTAEEQVRFLGGSVNKQYNVNKSNKTPSNAPSKTLKQPITVKTQKPRIVNKSKH